MNTQQALGVLIQAVEAATLKGAYSLKDAALIAEAVLAFSTPPKTETPKEDKKK